ncbi:MAG: hypothetical protein QOE77_3300 [Blastocatellia bacterium]|jgi:predicted phosphodiesterase|nr:hypothetical protein [Blastocatellia bacterium]
MFSILHITDLHIRDPHGSEEYLRIGFFDEYLDSLVVTARPLLTKEPKCLIVTGDFIDRGNANNFDHASTVIRYLADKLKMPYDQVVVCNGNHDILRAYETTGDLVAARKPFKDFASQFGNGTAIHETKRAVLLNPLEKLWCLMIDATLGSNGEDHPGNLESNEADELMGWIKSVPLDDLLVIGAHYPVHNIMAEGAVFDEEDPLWSKRHMWGKGEILKERIRLREERPQIIWLCGDIHKSFNVSHNGQRFMATGRLGTMTAIADSQVRRHARIINMNGARTPPETWLMEFVPIGHSSQSHLGRWKKTSEEQTSAQTSDFLSESPVIVPDVITASSKSEAASEPVPIKLLTPSVVAPVNAAEVASRKGIGIATTRGFDVELINAELQEELLQTIRDSGLYHFGRFDTADVEVSLAWISMGLLLNKEGILPSILSSMSEWLNGKLGDNQSESQSHSLLIGMDCWGSVIASQLSVLTGLPNICVAERGGGQHYLPSETLTSACFSEIQKAATIILVSDVVATGLSLVRLHQKIGIGDSAAQHKRWLALSIMCDEKQNRSADCGFLEGNGTTCKDLRMPILPIDQLPPENILAPLISFR